MAMNKKYTSMRQAVRKQAATRKSGGGGTKFNLPEGVSFYSVKKGTARLRVVPYVVSINKHPAGVAKGDIWSDCRVMIHFNVGADPKSYVCPRTVGQRCPICEYRMKLAKSANPDEQVLKDLKPKDRVLYNIVDLDNDPDSVMLWEISFHNFTKMFELEINEGPEEYGDYAMPDESGMNLSVRFVDKAIGGGKPFQEASRIDFKEARESLSDAVLEQALDLDAILKILPYEELESIFLEMDEDNDAKEDDTPLPEVKEDKPPRTPRKPKEDTHNEEDNNPDDEAKQAEEEAAKAAKIAKKAELAAAAAEKARKDAIRAAKAAKTDESKDGNDCPAGGVFGSDTDSLKACDTCPVWDACITKKES